MNNTSTTTSPPTASTTASATSPMWTAIRWLSVILAIGIVAMALIIGQGVWGGERGLITGHGHLGNAIFTLAGVQFALAVMLYQKKQVSASHMLITFVLVVLLLAQAGLGYSGRANSSLIAWHVPLGVLLMGVSTFNMALAWLQPRSTSTPVG
jgi:hypothetical protein